MIPLEPFEPFEKIPRLNRECIVTEKIDGTNAVVFVRAPCEPSTRAHAGAVDHTYHAVEDVDPVGNVCLVEACCREPRLSDRSFWTVHAGSKNRWLTPEVDNYGFATWVRDHAEELKGLGPGKHHGEWFGPGIQGRYGKFMKEKQFALFNVSRWTDFVVPNPYAPAAKRPPPCCAVVPILYRGPFNTEAINKLREELRATGSRMVPGAKAEGVVVFHVPSGSLFKATCERDEEWKGKSA